MLLTDPAEPTLAPTPQTEPLPRRRSFAKRTMHWIRRGHLYLGLFLFPWAILYGVTGFLFNHPDAFPDQPSFRFDKSAFVGTPLESAANLRSQAEAIVAHLNERQKPETPYRLGDGAIRYGTRDFIFANLKADSRTFTILYDIHSGGGTIREVAPPPAGPKAPFATVKGPKTRMAMTNASAVKIDGTLVDAFRKSMPAVFERLGLPSGELTVTNAPEILFPIEADGQTWSASCNLATNAVSGATTESSDLTVRRFLLRMHLTHTYPGETNAKWFWAIIVDSMAVVMCFWGLSGLLMWWQIKSTRLVGAFVLCLSAASAVALGIAMHGYLSQ